MGCDIHAVFQARNGSAWHDIESQYEENRHYFLFAWLAGVRNGHGFAGVPTHTPITPISAPRGLPSGFVVEDEHNGKWLGDHSFSWLTADEILAAPRPAKVWKTGIVDRAFFDAWDGHTSPTSYCGGISGRDVVVAESPTEVDATTTHVRISWPQHTDELAYFVDEIRRLQAAHGAVRMVFGFDS